MAGSLISGGLSLAGSLLGGESSSDGIRSAANTSADASRYAAELQRQNYLDTQQLNSPSRFNGLAAQTRMAQLLGLDQTGFNEAYYLKRYPDVAAAVAAGDFTSGAEHYMKHGKAEGRKVLDPSYSSGQDFGSMLESYQDWEPFNFQADPGYDWRMSQGLNALDRSAAARGGLQSGAALKEAARYGQNFASNEYQNAYSRWNNDETNDYNRWSNGRNSSFNKLASMAGMNQVAMDNISNAGANYANNAGNIAANNATNQGHAAIAQGNLTGSMYGAGANALAYGLGGLNGNSLTSLYGGLGGMGSGIGANMASMFNSWSPFDYSGYNAVADFIDP